MDHQEFCYLDSKLIFYFNAEEPTTHKNKEVKSIRTNNSTFSMNRNASKFGKENLSQISLAKNKEKKALTSK